MKIDRGEVEQVLAAVEAHGCVTAIERAGLVIELCRLALAVLDAPVGEVRGWDWNPSNYSVVVTMHGPHGAVPGMHERVRLVRDGGE